MGARAGFLTVKGQQEKMHVGKRFRVRPLRRHRYGAVFVAAALVFGAATHAAGDEVVSREQATAVIEQARRESAEIDRRYQDARRECEQGVLVNPCLEKARRERDQQARAVREREVAARDVLRRIDAEQRARERDVRAKTKAEDAAAKMERPTPEQPSADLPGSKRPPIQNRSVDPAQQQAAARKKEEEAARRRSEAEQRAAEQERRASDRADKAAQANAEAEKFEARQREAQAYAEEKARLSAENQRRREQRAKERSEGRK